MSSSKGSAADLIDMIRRKAPEYLDLLTAESDSDFEKAFDSVLGQGVSYLEQNKQQFKKLDEVGISAALAGVMSIPGLTVSQEMHSGGHVDLTFEADHCTPPRRMLGEAKIYHGPVYHQGGLSQLIERYTTGRECRGLVLAYVKQAGITGLICKVRKHLDDDLPLAQMGKTSDHLLKWSFISKHKHSSGEEIQVCHVGCNLY